ncbi:predicted protein [Plenodomus lingam JN3]|uniref:Predicted protein n=1 Tax=Leptosphaeria maculans (strain JN3 / isolate v23.1.3 / race Av1-4-5-6-7-8) TaxID=985895 RepID=E5A4L0_LEPMJ|nr:predicted protein [Plenodomus lingam JN3]CBX98558.1 predicted protein [Plenodomus lingam JN3]
MCDRFQKKKTIKKMVSLLSWHMGPRSRPSWFICNYLSTAQTSVLVMIKRSRASLAMPIALE